VPVIAVSAVRTGCGKSQTTRWLAQYLRDRGLTVAVIRHPMPYGDLEKQAVQRFATLADLQAANCTVEEREEYEPHLAMGNVVYAGVDYGRIVDLAAQEADLILWDGGNNDFPFIRPDLHLVLVDPLRAGHETSHHPGEVVLRMADIVIVAKVNAASTAQIQQVEATAKAINPKAKIVRAASPIRLRQFGGDWEPTEPGRLESAGDRRRTHHDPRRHGLWRGVCGGDAGPRRSSRRSASLCRP
jgi:predicted GTPase